MAAAAVRAMSPLAAVATPVAAPAPVAQAAQAAPVAPPKKAEPAKEAEPAARGARESKRKLAVQEDVYQQLSRERESQLSERVESQRVALAALLPQGVAMDAWHALRQRPSLAGMVGKALRGFVAGVHEGGVLRVALEGDAHTRLVELEGVSFPRGDSIHAEERRAAENCRALLEHVLGERLVALVPVDYDETIDRLRVRVFLPSEPPALKPGCKMLDALTRTELERAELPPVGEQCTQGHFVCVNSWLLRAKGCMVVMGRGALDWFVRVSDWKRFQALANN